MSRLWYRQPARIWEEAMPLGNGRMGAMVFGGVNNEHIQVNEESIWYGGKMDRLNPDALKYLPQIREYLKNGQIGKAQGLMNNALASNPNSVHPYQTLGDILFWFGQSGALSSYERGLDLENAICNTEYTLVQEHKGVETAFTREYFFSKPADCLVMHFTAKGAEGLSFNARLERGRFYDGAGKYEEKGICLYGNLGKGGFDFAMLLRAKAVGGSLELIGENIVVEGAKEVYLYFTADCTYHYPVNELTGDKADIDRMLQNMDKKLSKAMDTDYEALKQEHIADYRALFGRVAFQLEDTKEQENLPTDERLLKMQEGQSDVGMAKYLFDFGRYLLISCSRKGGLPANLQGVWNKDFTPAWDSKYTININTEMNYWPAEPCSLSECHEPLFTLIYKLRANGRRTAREMYGCRGFVAHHNTDMHGDTAPQDIYIPASYWVMGAAWLCTHLWTHYLYTQDKEFLKEAYPCMLEAALFFIDFLQEQDGYLVTNPSVSPENTYILPSGESGACCVGATMDFEIINDLFTACLKAAKVFGDHQPHFTIPGVDDISKLLTQLEETLRKLPPIKIDSKGRIMEWMEEYEEAEPGHRHISHLYALYPSEQITVDETPKLAAAARKTLEYRLQNGGGHTGWSRAWIMNHYARLWDGEKVYENIELMLRNSTYPNMFDKHPPFQIDGNFGACAAIAQTLVQSNEKRVILLPALPAAWKAGSVKGLSIVGGATIDLAWKDGSLTECTIHAKTDIQTTVKYGEQNYPVTIPAGKDWNFAL